MNPLQSAYDQFRKEYTLGKGAGREDAERAFRDKMKRAQETPIKAPDSNSAYFKAGGRGDVNSLRNKWR
jgi:hypothetical protein